MTTSMAVNEDRKTVILINKMNTFHLTALVILMTLVSGPSALDNGLARTPPMGWLSWQRFRCDVDCKKDPKSCVGEQLYMETADHLAADGYKEAGYVYVNIDDCWAAKERDPDTMQLVPDPARFPRGMKYLADYVHSKGLKLGIYGDMGIYTCGGYPGSKFTLELDSRTFADWGIDSLKMDGCYSRTDDFTVAYPILEFFLNKTGRPILYSCSWPAYQQDTFPDYPRIANYCNIWRNYDDISDSWDSVKSIIKYYGDDHGNFSKVSGPGSFNDPDMIIVGDKGLSPSQAQAQMAMWAIMASPLFISSDLRTIDSASRALLLNKGVLSINQDTLGIMGKRVWQIDDIQTWLRPVTPIGSYAVVVLNLQDAGFSTNLNFSLADLGVQEDGFYNLSEVFTGVPMGLFSSKQQLTVTVDVSSVFMGKFTIIQGN